MPESQQIQEQENEQISNQQEKKEEQSTDIFAKKEIQEKVQKALDPYKQTNSEIEKNFIKYLTDNPDKKERLGTFLEKNINDEEKCGKIINSFIVSSIKELEVFKQSTEQEKTTPKEENIISLEDMKTENKTLKTENINTKENAENIKKLIKETEQERQSLIKKHPKLDIQPGSSEYQNQQAKLQQNGTLDRLAATGLDQKQIDQFISFQATRDLIQTDPELKNDCGDFLFSLKKLENELRIPDASRESFSDQNLAETSQELFDHNIGNESLIQASQENTLAHQSSYEELFAKQKLSPTEKLADLSSKYGKFVSPQEQELAQKLIQKDPKTYTEQDKSDRSKTASKLATIEKSFETESIGTIEQANIMGPIVGIASYMNMDIGNDFEFNKSKDITYQDKILTITGTINNQAFTISNDLSKPTKLATSDYLSTTPEASRITISDNTQTNKQLTPFILPDEATIWKNNQETFKTTQTALLRESSSLQEYKAKLQDQLISSSKQLYGFQDLVKISIEKQMQKDIASQETIQAIQDIAGNEPKLFDKTLSKDSTDPKLFNLIQTIDNSLESYSISELEQRRANIKTFQTFVQKNSATNLSENNPIKLFFKQNFPEDNQASPREQQHKKVESLHTVFSSLMENKSSKTIINNTDFSKLSNELTKAVPDTNSLAENTQKLIEGPAEALLDNRE